jgi:hypothetical protein
MKTRTFVSILILVLAVLIILGSCATTKKVAKKDYRFFSGIWVNEEYNSHPFMAKYVIFSDGTFDAYNNLTDTGKHGSGHYIIVDKWTDSEGNRWYKMHVWGGVVVEGKPDMYELDKFSNSGNVWEFISLTGDFPPELDKSQFRYHIYYRQE